MNKSQLDLVELAYLLTLMSPWQLLLLRALVRWWRFRRELNELYSQAAGKIIAILMIGILAWLVAVAL